MTAAYPEGAPADDAAKPLRVLRLSELEKAALARQPQVRLAQSTTRAAEGVVEQVRSPFLPQLTGIGQYSYGTSVRTYTTNTIGGNTATMPNPLPGSAPTTTSFTTTSPTGYWNFSVSGTQLIYDFGQTYGRYRAAKETVDADIATEKATKFQVLVTVRTAYFTARANKDLVDVARAALADQERHLVQVKAYVEVGTQPQIALAQQDAAVATARVALVAAQNNYDTARAQLNQAAGVRGDTNYDVGDEEIGPIADENQPLGPLLEKALAARPEIASYAKQKRAQEATINSAKGAYGPTVSATGSAGEAGLNITGLQPVWSVGGLLTWQFFQGGLTTGQVHSAEATLDGLDAQLELQVLQVQVQVDSARLAVRAAKATIGSAQDAATSAHEQLRLAEQRYATGVGSIIELNDAQVADTTAAAQLVQARYQLASARAQLLAALGRT